MSNMSYCRFQNTAPDLQDCYEALVDGGFNSLSGEERRAAIRLINLCRGIVDDFGHLTEDR